MTNLNSSVIVCPKCGSIDRANLKVYDESLKKQNIDILPIHPTCKLCGSEVAINHKCTKGNMIVLNGTCGSGKTTVAERLAKMNWYAIDGDCAIQSLRHKTGNKKYDWNELIDEIAYEIDVLSLFTSNIVLSHIVLPEDLKKYEMIFRMRNLKYKLILLRPDFQSAVERCRTRTCHTSITPVEWIKHFYDALYFEESFSVIDNTTMSVEETLEHILKQCCPDTTSET